jgi:hypothetical protein
MNKVTKYIPIGFILFIFLACSAFPSGRAEEKPDRQEARMYWVLDGSMSPESAEMYLERYLFPTSLAAMLWTDFSRQGNEIRFDTSGGYRIVRKQRVLAEPIGAYTVYGYDLIVQVTWSDERGSASRRTLDSYKVRFSYPDSAETGSDSPPTAVLPQPLEQALIAGIKEDGRLSGKARVEQIEYLGSGRFTATVLIVD